MKKLFLISAILLIVDLVAIAFLAILKIGNQPDSSFSGEVSVFVVIAGVLTALVSLMANQRRVASEEYLENANDLLSKAYETLERSKDEFGVPKNSRINWLTAARLICTAEKIALELTEESHKRIWEEKKEYWRGLLRDLIYPNSDGLPQTYFANSPKHMLTWDDGEHEPLSEKSLTVLYRFIRWPKDREDPLNGNGNFTASEIEHMATFGPTQLGKFLQQVRELELKK